MNGVLLVSMFALGAPSAADVDYVRDIKPVLRAKCFSCHGAFRQKSGLRLDAVQLLLKGSKRGPVVVAGKPDESRLIEVVSGKGSLRMPPENEGEHLSAKELALFKEWIRAGAKAADEAIPDDPKLHWAYQT